MLLKHIGRDALGDWPRCLMYGTERQMRTACRGLDLAVTAKPSFLHRVRFSEGESLGHIRVSRVIRQQAKQPSLLRPPGDDCVDGPRRGRLEWTSAIRAVARYSVDDGTRGAAT